MVHEVNIAAFDTDGEAELVDMLRELPGPVISLVAELDGVVVGHILFTRVLADCDPEARIMGLAPMAVTPDQQRRGIGSQLVRAGLDRCRNTGAGAVVVLGHPSYYPRFGFLPATKKNISCEYDVPDDVFMIIELTVDYLSAAEGTIRYHQAFREM